MKIKLGFGYLYLETENKCGFGRNFEISLFVYGRKWYRSKRKIKRIRDERKNKALVTFCPDCGMAIYPGIGECHHCNGIIK